MRYYPIQIVGKCLAFAGLLDQSAGTAHAQIAVREQCGIIGENVRDGFGVSLPSDCKAYRGDPNRGTRIMMVDGSEALLRRVRAFRMNAGT
jgi:hypothetical protein